VLKDILSLKEAAAKQLMEGQEYKKCNYKAAKNLCKTKKCACFKADILCNSHCHL